MNNTVELHCRACQFEGTAATQAETRDKIRHHMESLPHTRRIMADILRGNLITTERLGDSLLQRLDVCLEVLATPLPTSVNPVNPTMLSPALTSQETAPAVSIWNSHNTSEERSFQEKAIATQYDRSSVHINHNSSPNNIGHDPFHSIYSLQHDGLPDIQTGVPLGTGHRPIYRTQEPLQLELRERQCQYDNPAVEMRAQHVLQQGVSTRREIPAATKYTHQDFKPRPAAQKQ